MEEGSSLGFPMRNGTHVPLESLKLDSNMIWLLLSLCSAIIWVVYISFYNSRVIGYFITKLANRLFIKGAYFKIGSLTMNPLAGKIMFRDVVYICFDYTVRIQDGYVIFRWWRSYVPKDVSEDLSHSDTRLSVMLNGLELHCYNRTELYARLEKTFGLKPTILVPTENMSSEEAARIRDQAMNLENDRQTAVSISENCKQDFKKLKKHKSEAMAATTWRDLIPVIKIDICSGRFVFGNRLTPTTLSICVEEAHCVYSTKPAVSRLDHFMHFVKAKADNAKVLLAPSPKYTGLVDDPPRYMGEGFVVMMSNLLELYFYMDEPGVVPEQPYHFTLSTGDVVEAAPPVWGIDIKCGKGTDFSYGPWADRQRDHLFRFFFPPDWQTMQVTQALKPGEQREYQSFEVSLSTLNEATIDILFSKNKETNATHVTIGAGSYMEVTLPWVTGQNGYTTKVSGQLLHVEATTSLQYRSLAECESLEFKVRIHYPLRWNDHQEWVINLTGCKATAWIVYTHKNFFQDLIEDWASKSRPDILNFVPYTWKFCILLKEFEILMLTNEFNWIDCSSTNQENHHLAFCGDLFDLSFNLPFDDYLPATVPLRFWIHGEGLDLSLYIPEISTSRPIILALDENLRILTRDGQIKRRSEIETKKWRRVCQKSSGWIDCWQVPIVALSIQYVYHPIPPLGPDPQADITTPEKEEILLSPMRMPKLRKSPVMALQHAYDAKKFDPMLMAPDKVSVELEIGSSILIAYGTILRNFIHLKENIFGEDQAFTDMENVNTKSTSSGTGSSGNTKTQNTTSSTSTDQNKSVSEASVVLSGNNGTEEKPKRFDPRLYRPLEVIVSVTIHDIQAHLVKNCNENDPPCPIVLIERLGFEMKKRFQETELQVLVSPSFLICPDNSVRTNKDKHLRQGHLLLSAVQVRGHAMFSNEGRAVHEETLEYAWLLEVQLGKLSGKLSTSQMCHLVTGLETLLMLTMDAENELRPSRTLRYCHHGMPTNECQHTKEETKYKCPSSEDIKYRMTRIAIDAVDLYLVESGTALHTWISPIRLSTCNLHGQNVKSGITALIPTVLVRNFVSSGGHFNHTHFTNNAANNSHSNTNTTGSGRSARLHRQSSKPDDGKEDLNILVSNKKEDAFKCKKESDYGVYRRGSKDKDDSFSTYRRSRESDFQFRRDNDIYASFSCQRRDTDSSEPWLEVGCVSFGPIIMEAASALPIPEHCLNLVQHNYLKIHDDKTKRLWFLWTTTIGETRCGCVGGCAFFGSNRNGARFFKPNPQDLQDAINIARYHIHPNIREYGFGQSLLHEGQLVFHTPPYSLQSISLQENYNPHEAVNGAVRTTVPGRTSRLSSESKSPLPPKHEMRKTAEFQSSNTLTRDKQGQSLDNKMPPSPATLERKSRRFSYTNTRQTAPQPEVPYARLLDSPSKINQMKAANQTRQETESRLLTPKALRMPNSKTSASDSKLTTDYFQAHFSDHQSDFDGPPFPLEMSHSAPQPNPLESDSSEHSLSPRVISEEEIIQVQRTISLTSENPSEAFFSADEDMVNMSRNSACDGSVTLTRPQKKRFASDLSIGGGVGKNDKMSVLISEGSMSNKLSTHRSDYEIHTPEHRSITKMRPQSTAELTENERRIHGLATPLRKLACNNGNSSNVASGSSSVSPRPEFRHFKPVYDPASQESSSGSPSLSSNSFISALSSQEDITLVNLHMQINRPIVDSPLLMASYVTHLTQYRCPNWSSCSLPYGADAFSTPLFQQNEDGGLVYIGSKLLPHFDAHSGTIKNIRIIPRKDCVGGGVSTGAAASSSNIPQQFDAKPHPWDPNIVVRASDSSRASKNVDEDSEFIGGASNSPDDTTATRNSIIVRMKGQVDIMLTPLLLEGLQRLIESATLTLSTLHPLTVVNYLHASCIRKVEAANVLKRDQSLSYWSQVHSNSKRSTAERNLQGPGGPILTDVYEESISTQLQGLVTLPKINITLIQSSVVEEVISFAALDNVQDLSCASLLAVCIDNVSTRFHLGKTTKASMHTVYTQPTIGDRSSGLKKGGLMRGTRALLAHLSSQTRPDNIPGEPVLIETSEKQLEEIVITLEIGKTHAQLRRLKNEGCALQESQTIVTAIPPHRSRAMFECIKSAGSVDDVTAAGVAAVQSASETATVLGYIMFECGLEGVAVKIVKRSQFEKSENSGNDMTAARNELQEQPNDDVITAKKVAINIEKVVSEAAPVKIAKKTVVASANLFLQGVKPTTPKEKFMFSSETASRQKEKDVKDGPSTSSRASLKAVSKDQNIEEDESKKKIEVPPVLAVAKTQENNGRTSSCCIDLRTVWFNFAAPPRAPITRKIDFTRLDWNLLSTASPSITAWMNPSNRFAIKLVAMTRAIHMRRTAVAACLMADALEVQSVQRRVKSRYTGKFTPLSKTLQEDPSCQLCTIMNKLVTEKQVSVIEEMLKQTDLPQLHTLRRGVIVLSRQWKNTLYNPMLFEHQYKNKLSQPINVAFSVPQFDEDCDDAELYDPIIDEEAGFNNAGVLPQTVRGRPLGGDTNDENEMTLLLGGGHSSVEHDIIHQVNTISDSVKVNSSHELNIDARPTVVTQQHTTAAAAKLRKRSVKKLLHPSATNTLVSGASSSRSSIQMIPIISGFVDKTQSHAEIEYDTLKDGSLPSIGSSTGSLNAEDSYEAHKAGGIKEDLYAWMAKQQQSDDSGKESKTHSKKDDNGESTLQTATSPPRFAMGAPINGYVQDSVKLLDAHLIFEPILSCLGVMPQQMVNNIPSATADNMSASLDSLGTNLSLVGSFDTMRIDIVVSESTSEKKSKPKVLKKGTGSKFSLNMPTETPAFLCERVGVELEVIKVTDGVFPKDDSKPNVLYLSRGQLKKHTSTVINFSLNVRHISQQVNMPLLRLLHQISNMYQNVREAQNELKSQPDTSGKRNTTQMKDESSLASEINDPTLIIDDAQHLLDIEERYDKFNETVFLGHSVSRQSATRIPPLGQLIPLTPSPGGMQRAAGTRPQSFAQKLRSTSKTVKGKLGYTNLSETVTTPTKTSPTSISTQFDHFKVPLDHKSSLSGLSTVGGVNNDLYGDALMGHSLLITPAAAHMLPKCWKTMYHLLDLYASMPETKTVSHRVSISPDVADHHKFSKKYNILNDSRPTQRDEDDLGGTGTPNHQHLKEIGVVTQERTRLVVFGVVKIQKTRLLATLSGLKLEAEIGALHSSATWRKKSRPAALECSLTGQVGRAMIVLLEGVHPNQQTVVKVTVGKSQTLYSSVTRRSKDKNSGLLSIGAINIDIPQHPVALHGMMTRSSKQLSSTLQELRVTRTSTRLSKQAEEPESPQNAKDVGGDSKANPNISSKSKSPKVNTNGLLQPLVMQFNIMLQSLSVTAALLPSLQAQYKMNHVSSTGVSGSKAKFTIDLPSHTLSFTTKVQTTDNQTNLPSEASIALPPVHVSAEYVPENAPQDVPIDGVVLRQGGYVSASAEIGDFDRCLTTDLLNHLVFVQKVFMKEVNEVVQKVYGGEKPVPLWLEDSEETASTFKRILFSLNIKVKRIQLTATTPCNSAVRFETCALELHLSNRVKNLADASHTKLFGKAQIDLNLSLGQIIKNVMFDEAEPEFQQYAFFNTTIGLRNAFQDEMLNDDKELVLITLKRPLIYVQPVAVDKAILVWLNYKNAYEYWAEKRANLNKEVLTATQQVFEKVPFGQFGQHLGAGNLSTLFLQLTVEDMGICLPLNQLPLTSWPSRSFQEFEQKGAVVITLESTIISACNSGSLVSKGKFAGLCLRFADDFETTLDDWKPNQNDSNIMNLCVVSEGTYEVCSRTIAARHPKENAKWFLNVKWQMEGVDIHLDVNIGKQLSALGHTLTTLTGFEEDDPTTLESNDSEDGDQLNDVEMANENKSRRKVMDHFPAYIFDPNIDPRKRSIMMEKEMNEQLKIINDLRTLGASTNTISHEERRLQELQALCYKYFRRDMMQRWKRPSMRKPMLRTSNRSQSFVEPSPTGDIPMMDNVSDIKEDFEQITPRCGPSRSASMRIRNTPQRVTFTDAMRQSSLPSAESEASFPQEELEWESVSYENDCIDVPHMLDIDGEQVELRKKQTLYNQKQQEPNIDFELDIKVLVNSGKCVLHTKDNLTDDKLSVTTSTLSGGMPSGSRHHKRERSIGTDWMREGAGGSPIPSRRNKDKNRIRYNASNNTAVLVDLTIFHIPGLDVKLHYESRTVADESSNRLSAIDCLSVKPKISSKRAALFAWMTLQSIPEETIISPHILEFLEQTLEPIPSSSWKTDNVDPSKYVNAAAVDLLQNNYVTVSSFPVDVIVYFHMQPSTFRFSCLPVSRVECMLQLPSLDIVFSSKRQNQPNSEFDTIGKPTSSSGGGLSVTGCLADFNVYIFHPYGGKKSGIKEAQFSPLADSERKDSLSVNVEFVKFHITRSRKLNFEPKKSSSSLDPSSQRATIRFSTIVDIGTASFKYDMRRLTEILAFPKAWYRRRIVRRLFLGDLSVPQTSSSDLNCTTPEAGKEPVIVDKLKPYSNTEGTASERSPLLVNRDKLNFAENANRMRLKDTGRSSSLDTNGSPSYEQAGQISAWETLVLFAVNFTKLNVQMNMGNVMGNVIWLTKGFRSDGRLSIGSTGHKNLYIGIGLGGSALDAKGGIVGGSFELNKIDTHVHIREEPGVEPKHTVGIELMAMELRLDYMGTSVLMARISSLNATLRDEWKGANSTNKQPTIILIHGDLSWDQLQIMISKSTTADILKIFYKLEEFFSQQFKSSKRVFSSLESRFPSRGKPDHLSSLSKKNSINSRKKNITPKENEENVTNSTDAKHHRHWQHPILQAYGLVPSSLGVPLPKSGIVLGGTMELHGTNISLACFHGINFKAKSWALFSLKDPCINFATEAKQLTHTANSSASDAPTEEQIHIIQTLTFGLGINTPSTTPQHHSMATVCRMSRNVIFPPQFKTLHEWFHYAFANSEIDGVGRFPVLERDREVNTNSIERSRGAGGGSGSASATSNSKVLDHNHNREVVFALPSLQLHFKTDHLQGVLTPKPDAEKPTVECSFITEFEDHIFVTVDADAFFFLHDLFMSYLREKERVIGVQNARSASPNPMGTNVTASSSSLSSHNSSKDNLRKHKDSETASTSDSAHSSSTKKDHYVGGSAGHDKSFVPKSDLEALLADWRHFECKTWHLEPTVRLLSWAGKSIEPYGIDYILNKLGFRHARTTIPKWLQRGVMDPLDKLEAIMIFQLLMLVKEDGKNYK